MSIRYEMDKLNFDWRMNQMQFTFVPGDIEFKVTQQPDVVIKYSAARSMSPLPPTPTMSRWIQRPERRQPLEV